MSIVWVGASLSFVIGALAGFSELISRYRDEPLRAAANVYGGGYLVANGLLSTAAYALQIRYPTELKSSRVCSKTRTYCWFLTISKAHLAPKPARGLGRF
jgi:hypothetical protein